MPNFKKPRIKDESYRKYIRSLPCSVPGCEVPQIECAHLRYGGLGGVGLKASDEYTNPLCFLHHREQGEWDLGEADWWMRKVITPLAAKRYREWFEN